MEPFIGQVMLFAGNFAPVGWAFCNGQLMSIAEYTALFSILGTTYGGDGITTFALPDLQGRAPIGTGNGPGLSPQTLGESSGQESVTLTSANLPPTANVVPASTEKGTTNAPHAGSVIANAKGNSFSSSAPATRLNAGSLVPNNLGGSSQPISTGGPRLAVSYIIALEGIFPSRS
jgi:microcystin-dependent protein